MAEKESFSKIRIQLAVEILSNYFLKFTGLIVFKDKKVLNRHVDKVSDGESWICNFRNAFNHMLFKTKTILFFGHRNILTYDVITS